jgi:hypothetical protein
MNKEDVELALLDACSALGAHRGTVTRKTALSVVCPDKRSVCELVQHAQHTVHSTFNWKPSRHLPHTFGDLIDQVWDQKMGQQTNTAC